MIICRIRSLLLHFGRMKIPNFITRTRRKAPNLLPPSQMLKRHSYGGVRNHFSMRRKIQKVSVSFPRRPTLRIASIWTSSTNQYTRSQKWTTIPRTKRRRRDSASGYRTPRTWRWESQQQSVKHARRPNSTSMSSLTHQNNSSSSSPITAPTSTWSTTSRRWTGS